MKKVWNKLVALAVAVVCVASVGVTAGAAEVAQDCSVTFSLQNQTNGLFEGDVAVTLFNPDTGLEYNYTIADGDSLHGIAVAGMVAQGDYAIALSYEGKDDFVICNADGSAIDDFSANKAGHTFRWVIVPKEAEEVGAKQPQGGALVAGMEKYAVETGMEDADAIWAAFLNSVACLENDEDAELLERYRDTTWDVVDSRDYEKATGRSGDEYLAMSPFERFLWCVSYVGPYLPVSNGNYELVAGSLDSWMDWGGGYKHHWIEAHGATLEQLEAYKALVEWEYEYFKEHGTIFNFITGKTAVEERNGELVKAPDVVDAPKPETERNESGLTKEERKELEAALESELTKEEQKELKDAVQGVEREDDGIWGDTKSAVKDNALSIVILFVLVGTVVGVTIYRKKKAVDDE